jgi:hypothetical protein
VSLDPAIWGTVFPELVRRSKPARAILGFRVSRIHAAGWPETQVSLMSMNGRYFWQPGRNTARCLVARTRHAAPASGCSCGFYACHRLRPLEFVRTPPNIVLVGVAGSGTVRIHERGWRAQFARILAVSDEVLGRNAQPQKRLAERTARALEATYHVPVVPLNKLPGVMFESGEFVEEIK